MTTQTLTIGGQTKRSTLGQHPVEIDFDTLPDASKSFVIAYGLRQYLADAMAGAESAEDAKAKIESRRDKLVSGDLSRTRGEGLTAPDSEGGRALKLAKAAIRAAMKVQNVKADKDAINEAASKMIAADGSWLEKAKKQLADESKLSEGVDISALIAMANVQATVEDSKK